MSSNPSGGQGNDNSPPGQTKKTPNLDLLATAVAANPGKHHCRVNPSMLLAIADELDVQGKPFYQGQTLGVVTGAMVVMARGVQLAPDPSCGDEEFRWS